MSSKIDIARKRRTIRVRVEEWESDITLRALSVGQIREVEKISAPEAEIRGIYQLSHAIVDDNGETIYTPEDLMELSPNACAFLVSELAKLHVSTPSEVEETVKN